MKKYSLILAFAFTLSSFSQGYPPVEDASSKTEVIASEIANAYDRQLSMTAEQKALFKIRVEDFLIRRKEITASKKGKEQLDALVNMQAEETLAMNDILTRPQMDVYKRIKTEIQPLKIVEPTKDN